MAKTPPPLRLVVGNQTASGSSPVPLEQSEEFLRVLAAVQRLQAQQQQPEPEPTPEPESEPDPPAS